MKRLLSIDTLKTLAILLMIQGHFVYYLSPWYQHYRAGEIGPGDPLFWWVDLESLSAPMFAFLAGMSVWFWIQKHQAKLSPQQYSLKLYKRSALIYLMGFVVSGLFWLDVGASNILHLIGAGIALVTFVHRWPLWTNVLLVLLMLAVAPVLQQHHATTPSHKRRSIFVMGSTIPPAPSKRRRRIIAKPKHACIAASAHFRASAYLQLEWSGPSHPLHPL